MPQHGEEWTNVIVVEVVLSWSEAIGHNIWKLMSIVRTSLYRIEKVKNLKYKSLTFRKEGVLKME